MSCSPAEAQLALGQMLLDQGRADAALDHFAQAARLGEATGFTMLGRAAERGWGMVPDPALAAAHYRRAAGLGEVWAMFNLADLHLRGEGVVQDPAAARALYAQAAAGGLALGLTMLGTLAEDDAQALELFRAAAKADEPWAKANLARMENKSGAVVT